MVRVFRDPVHNIISFHKKRDRLFLDLVDSREMQRLRRIRQLGFSYVTYLGAEHSRFAHSLGCAHLMKRMVDKLAELRDDNKDGGLLNSIQDYRELLICAAILHDVGHGPFSHILEKVTGKKHEHWTREIIMDPTTEVNQILAAHNKDYPQKIGEIIAKVFVPQYVVKLLSSQMDVDRIDYLLRDSLMTGADYGSFDLEWLLRSLAVGDVQGNTEIGIHYKKGQMVAEDFILARRAMYLQVYFHKTTRSAEVLIRSILRRAIDLTDNGVSLSEYRPVQLLLQKQPLTTGQYLGLDDHVLMYHFHKWQGHKDTVLSDLCSRLLNRKLLKSISFDDYPENYVDLTITLRKACDEAGLPHQYYLAEDKAPHSSYKDFYIVSKQTSEETEEEVNREVSERVYLFRSNQDAVELSVASEIISALRNKKIYIKRLYYPREIEETVKQVFGGG